MQQFANKTKIKNEGFVCTLFSEKRPRAVASAREISYDRGKGGDGVIEILEQTPGLVVCIKPVGVRAGRGEADALPALLKSSSALVTPCTGSIRRWAA